MYIVSVSYQLLRCRWCISQQSALPVQPFFQPSAKGFALCCKEPVNWHTVDTIACYTYWLQLIPDFAKIKGYFHVSANILVIYQSRVGSIYVAWKLTTISADTSVDTPNKTDDPRPDTTMFTDIVTVYVVFFFLWGSAWCCRKRDNLQSSRPPWSIFVCCRGQTRDSVSQLTIPASFI